MSTTGRRAVLFIGLGAMGSRMCPHLANDYNLAVSDLDAARASDIAGAIGARAVATEDISSVLSATDVVILMLPDSKAVESVVTDTFVAQLPRGGLIIDMGSSHPVSTVALAEKSARCGVIYVDAPVSGGTQRATDGTLTIMVGGSDEGFRAAQQLLSLMGNPVTHVGGSGAGHALKSLNNLLSAIGLAAASEVLAIGTRFGLKASTMLDVINTATGRNHATEIKFKPYVLSHQFDSGFALKLMVKDLRLALDLAEHTGTPTAIAKVALEQWIDAEERLGGGADHTHYAAYIENKAGIRFE